MKKKSLKVLIAVAGAIMTQVICAKTVAWYHFDEGVSGEKTSGGTPQILNAVDPDSLRGTPYQMNSQATPVKVTSGEYLPVFADVFPNWVSWLDPVTGVKGKNRRGLSFSTSSANGEGHSSVILVNDDEKLHCQQITVEAMIKYTAENKKNSLHLCLMRNSTGNKRAWIIQINSSGKLYVELNGADNKQGKNTARHDVDLLDGNWHHIAFSYNGSTIYWYVDYKQVHAQSYSGGLLYSDNLDGMLCIGGNDQSNYG